MELDKYRESLAELRRELAATARFVYDRGLQTGNGGNLSARLPGTEIMIIKPSGGSFAECDEHTWIVCDLDGHVLEGEGKPSSEYPVHAYIYRTSARVNCVIHTHDPYMITCSNLFEQEVPVHAHHSPMKLGSPIPVLRVETPGITADDLWRVGAQLERHPKLGGFLHMKHGGFALGETCKKALYNAELMRETCQVAFLMYLAQK